MNVSNEDDGSLYFYGSKSFTTADENNKAVAKSVYKNNVSSTDKLGKL